ncbi:von Willebrand factor type A domain, partial [Geosmithia morbida]
GAKAERTGLSVLDLVKHAAMAIIEILDEKDRLGVVVSSTESKAVQDLTVMTEENKDAARARIRDVSVEGCTDLWRGILDGIRMRQPELYSPSVTSVVVLTDGITNHMNVPQGVIPKLQDMPCPPSTMFTFTFDYDCDSCLLESIAELCGGIYAFTPDAGMVGTVFIRAVANVQSTFARDPSLPPEDMPPLKFEEMTGGIVARVTAPSYGMQSELRINLRNLQYGQSRGMFLSISGAPSDIKDEKLTVVGILTCIHVDEPQGPKLTTACSLQSRCDPSRAGINLPDAYVACHEFRPRICQCLSYILAVPGSGVHVLFGKRKLCGFQDELKKLVASPPANKPHDNPSNISLLKDLVGEEPQGQVFLALGSDEYMATWGRHCLPAFLGANGLQQCNSFKYLGPLQYGAASPLFVTCRDRLNSAFDNLPVSEPSPTTQPRKARLSSTSYALDSSSSPPTHRRVISMSRYSRADGPCFAGSTPVELASGQSVAVRKLRRGTKVRTPVGPRKVAAVVKTHVSGQIICRIGGRNESRCILVTPWHPISADGGKTFAFPATRDDAHPVMYTGPVYSVLLQRDTNASAHAIRIGSASTAMWGVTLGHGLVTGPDVRAHTFLGDYNRVGKALIALGPRRRGFFCSGGVVRDRATGRISGFKRAGGEGEPAAFKGTNSFYFYKCRFRKTRSIGREHGTRI